MRFVDASIQTIDGAHTVDDTTIDVSDAGELVAPGVIKVWDAADASVLKAVISFTGISTNQLTGCVWDYGGHTDVNLADGDFVAQELPAHDFERAVGGVASRLGPDDDYWEKPGVLDGSWTEVNPSGTQTLTVGRGRLSVLHDDIATADIGAVVKPLTGEAAGSALYTDVLHLAFNENFTMGGLVFSDGNAVSSNIAALLFYVQSASNYVIESRGGTFQAVGATVQSGPVLHPLVVLAGPMYLRWTWSAANTFVAEFSPDGVTWFAFGMANSAITLTPTHGGVFWTGWGAGTPRISSFGPFLHDAP